MDGGRFKQEVYFSQRPSKCSIVLNNMVKTVNNKTVLNIVNLTAHSGQICAVLGERNSGKSILLSCLVGGSKIDKGNIWVLGGKPRTKSSRTLTKYVGYMPQEFCLYQTVTFLELLAYFGQLYDINYDFIVWRIKYFYEMFKLPPTNVTIENLSFSEKRMVSFIVSVFHRPRLVVLDEPTVGLDIFKKLQIWDYLNQIVVRWKPTVIVATSNVEEAFLATKIAYLRNKKIVFDEKVERLQNMNPNKSIDIIIDDHYNDIITNLMVNKRNTSNQTEVPHNKKLSLYKKINPRSSIWKLKAITMQHMKFLTRNIWMCILIVLIPIIQVILHCVYYGQYPSLLPIAVYNQEADCVFNLSERIENSNYSCNLLHYIKMNKIKPIYYDSESLARDSIKKGLNLAYMKIPSNYTKAMVKTLKIIELIIADSPFDYEDKPTLDDPLSKYSISTEIDMSQFEFGNHLKQNLMNAHKSHLVSVYEHYNMSAKWADIPYKINEYKNLNLAENTASEIISCAIFSTAMFHSALLLHSEIENGYLMRNIIAGIIPIIGVTIFEILLCFLCMQTIFSALQAFFCFFFVDFLLHIDWQSSLLLIILLNLAIGTCGMSIGLVVGSFAKSSKKVFCITLIVYFINMTISGLFWPIHNRTNSNAIYLAVLSPLPIPINSIKHIMIEGHKYNSNYISHAVIPITIWTSASIITFIYNI